jgi:hypothetical protein
MKKMVGIIAIGGAKKMEILLAISQMIHMYVLIPRYVMACDVEIPDQMMEKGLYVVDYETAKMDSSKWTRNGICNIHTYGDFDIGRLCYNDDEECVGFLLTGTAVSFETVYFTTKGTAPLGRKQEDWEDDHIDQKEAADESNEVQESGDED